MEFELGVRVGKVDWGFNCIYLGNEVLVVKWFGRVYGEREVKIVGSRGL